jgi:hypothetical protein
LDEDENVYVTNGNAYEVFVFSPGGMVIDRIAIDLGPAPDPRTSLYGIAFEVLPVPPDFDGDGDVDLGDCKTFTSCLELSGPALTPPFQECLDVFDLDLDFDVDMVDFAVLARLFTGSI